MAQMDNNLEKFLKTEGLRIIIERTDESRPGSLLRSQ